MLIQYGWHGLRDFSMPHVVVTCLTYATGMVVYNARMPERSWPGTFDIWVGLPSLTKYSNCGEILLIHIAEQGASHQVFHILASISQLVHLLGLRSVITRRYTGLTL